ncbi:hypothetical protein D3C86_1601090 [compost metagenome]
MQLDHLLDAEPAQARHLRQVGADIPDRDLVQASALGRQGLGQPTRQQGAQTLDQLPVIGAAQVVVQQQAGPTRRQITQQRPQFGTNALGQQRDAQRQLRVGLLSQHQQERFGASRLEAHQLASSSARKRRSTASDSALSPCTQRLSAQSCNGLPSISANASP